MSLRALLTIVIACVLAGAIGWFAGWAVTSAARRRRFVTTAVARCRTPWTATLVTAVALGTMGNGELGGELGGDGWSATRHAVLILLIGSVTWLLVAISRTAEDAAARKLRIDVENNRRVRKIRTQVTIVRRIVSAVLVLVGASVALMTFDKMRTLGASLLASAGIAGIVGGLAAQSTLSNVFAGLQLAFTDELRIDDVVVVEDEWGRVEDITLTYIVVHLWDERRLVLPTTYFTTTPFQNWTRTSARVLGAVQLYVDFHADVERLRAEAERVVRASPLWDGQVWTLQVIDATELTMVVRVLASATDAERAFDLRCEVREKLIRWLASQRPASVPQVRVVGSEPASDRGPDRGSDRDSDRGSDHDSAGRAARGAAMAAGRRSA